MSSHEIKKKTSTIIITSIRFVQMECCLRSTDCSLFQNSSDGVYTLHKAVPDTVTSWAITAFALDPVTGLAITENPTELRVLKQFSVSLNLPYSIKRGEVLSVPIVVVNAMNAAINAEVTLLNEDQDFEFVDIGGEMNKTPSK